MKKLNFLDKLKKETKDSTNVKPRKSHIPFRLNLLFFVIFGLFVTLIVRLGYLQIAEGQKFVSKSEENSVLQVKSSSTPRGGVYDAKGKLLVGNETKLAITYTRGKQVQAEDLLQIADKVNGLINVSAEELTERDKKDFWLADPEKLKEAQKRLTDEDKKDEKGNIITNQSELYTLTVEKVTPEEINFDEEQLKVATIFKRMNAAQELNTIYIKNQEVTEDEIAIIGEHSTELPGVSTGVDWDRTYPIETSLRNIFGTVSTEKTGLPEGKVDEYLAKGYERNDRVGLSYLENYYEDQLKGQKSVADVSLDSSGKIVSQTIVEEGKKGSNLKLTIDLDFQNKVEEIVTQYYQQLLATGNAPYSTGAYVVAMDPNTGAVLSMVGLERDPKTNEITSNPLSVFTGAATPGSVVKGATLSAGYEQGVISGNDILIDEPLQFAGSSVKSSYFNKSSKINLTAEEALEYSSNVYMMKLVLKMMNTEYEYGMSLPYADGDDTLFNVLRKSYAEYGLGEFTEIDLPNESKGMKNISTVAKLLDLSFGQSDTYTALQLAQYVSTIANGGKRVAPHVVEGVYGNQEDGSLGELNETIETKVLNEVSINDEQMKIIQQGFYDVVHGTGYYTTGRMMQGAKLDMAAKTGTAESNYDGNVTVNSNVVAYAPYDNPEIAVSVVLPNLDKETGSFNQLIAKAVVDAYADHKEQK